MVLTEKQRSDLHAGIYDYLLSQPGDGFARAAAALLEADPNANSSTATGGTNNGTPLLEKKWTAVSRLQKKVLELERRLSQTTKMATQLAVDSPVNPISTSKRRMLPRPPAVHCLKGHCGNVTCVTVHPVFTVMCSGSDDATIKLWDHESGDYIRTLKGHTSTVHSLSFAPFNVGSHLASSSSDLSIKIWDFKTYSCIRTLRGHDHTISAVACLPPSSHLPGSRNLLVSCSRDKTVKFWELESGFCVSTTEYHSDWVRCVDCKRDGSMLATSGNDSLIVLYSKDCKKVGELRGCDHVVESLSFVVSSVVNNNEKTKSLSATTSKKQDEHHYQHYLASGGRDRCVRLWNTQSMECLSIFAFHENWVRSVLIHPSGNYIISAGDDRSIRVLDIKQNRCLRTIDGAHEHFVTSLSMHHTLPILVSGSVDQTLKCWMLD